MSRHTKEKRKKQKLKKEAEVKEEQLVFDIFSILQTENLDTKPNMAKFLKNYVKCITGCPKVKPTFYPTFELDIYKYFIKFFDGHELIVNLSQKDLKYRFIFCYDIDEVQLDQKELKLAEDFFNKIVAFNFVQPQS